jgi:poly-gamma-glutamate synthesis protein (capsule biosynthesis protein)
MASTFSDFADALPPQGRAPGRPGLSALRVERTVVVTPETLRQLRSVQAALADPGARCEVTSAWEAEQRRKEREPSDELKLLGLKFRVGEHAAYRYEMNSEDLADILKAIRLGKQHSDLLVATIHAHETGLGCEEPGDFLPVLARAAIDAGAGVFIGHGEHRLMPIEIYKGRPIFYSLANFFWSDVLEPLSASTWETNREMTSGAYADPAKATDADLLAAWNAQGFDDARVFETVIAVSRWEAGRVADVRLYPVDLGYGERLTRSGTPRLASPPVARRILERLQRISKPYGTTIAIEGDVGVIRLAPASPAKAAR